jgi:hypothetical protein
MKGKTPMRRNRSFPWPVVSAVIIVILITIFAIVINRASIQRGFKSLQSEYANGIDRTITVYDYNGEVVKTYSGKFDVTESETGIMFDDSETGKRVIITGGIIINEEN